jgi:membrane protease YdiL (CAAX protease family)
VSIIQPENPPPEIVNTPPEIGPPPVAPPPPKPGVWEGWPTVGFGAAIFAVYFVAQSIVAVAFAIGNLINVSANDINQAVSALATNGLLISVATVVSAIAGVGFIVLFIKIRNGPAIAEYLGLKSIRVKTFLTLIGVVVALMVAAVLLDQFLSTPKDTGFTVDAFNTSRWPVLFGFAVVVFAPLFEELFFRGFIFVGLKASKIGVVGAIFLTALAWALLHLQYDIGGMATIFVLGIVFGIVRWKTNSLWSTLFLHAVWNLMALVATVIAVSS